MSSLFERIDGDFKNAMKAKQPDQLSTLRLLRTALKNKQIDVQRPLDEREVVGVVKSQIKQLRDALELYIAGGRKEEEEKIQQEIDLLQAYLPQEISDEALEAMVQTALQESDIHTKAEMGKAMGAAMKAVAGAADASRVRVVVERLLS